MRAVGLIGCGFVADLYMRSLALYDDLSVAAAHDTDAARLAAFCAHWDVPPQADLQDFLAALPEGLLDRIRLQQDADLWVDLIEPEPARPNAPGSAS